MPPDSPVNSTLLQVERPKGGELKHLKDSGRKEGSVASVQLSTADDDEGEPKGQTEGTVEELLCPWVRLLDLHTTYSRILSSNDEGDLLR